MKNANIALVGIW